LPQDLAAESGLRILSATAPSFSCFRKGYSLYLRDPRVWGGVEVSDGKRKRCKFESPLYITADNRNPAIKWDMCVPLPDIAAIFTVAEGGVMLSHSIAWELPSMAMNIKMPPDLTETMNVLKKTYWDTAQKVFQYWRGSRELKEGIPFFHLCLMLGFYKSSIKSAAKEGGLREAGRRILHHTMEWERLDARGGGPDKSRERLMVIFTKAVSKKSLTITEEEKEEAREAIADIKRYTPADDWICMVSKRIKL